LNFFRKINLLREEITLSDGGKILLEWGECPNGKTITKENEQERVNPLIIIVPGLTGGSATLYMTSLVLEAYKNNCDVVVVNYRS
jgi:predicted alpha/beta-fold hydrolase